ncbi:hypothetical protein [Kineosporia mesophila]|nr:hypothetical protein [Kineosporia mesophila]
MGTSEDDAFRHLHADSFPAILSYALRRVGSLDDAGWLRWTRR